MKKILPILIFVLFVSMFSVSLVGAEEGGDGFVVLSNVAVRESKIISQKDNVVNLSFKIDNEKGSQVGIKYGVQLVKDVEGKQIIVDDYIDEGVINIKENSVIEKNFNYEAPSNINGEFKIYIVLKNEKGLSVGVGYAGLIKLNSTIKSIEILPETCFLTVSVEKNTKYNLYEGVDIDKDEQIILNCEVINNSEKSITISPEFKTHYRNIFGEVVSQTEVENPSITLGIKENKILSFLLPKAMSPQAYDVEMILKSGTLSSNAVIAHYVIRGQSGTIQNITLDKSSYNKGESANISLSVSPSADSFPYNRSRNFGSEIVGLNIRIDISNENKKNCIQTINQEVFDYNFEVSADITNNCAKPKVEVTLMNANGDILDQQTSVFDFSNEATNDSSNKMKITIFIILGLIIISSIYYLSNIKKNEKNIQ